jgi:hypothetical protein
VRAVLLLIFLLGVTSGLLAVGEPVSAEYKPVFRIARGNGYGQLLWLTEENGGILDGPFQGPMAFLVDENGTLWAGDTLNARIICFHPDGKPEREIDLLAAARAAGLASDPVLLDFVREPSGRILVADAGNNVVLALDARGGSPFVYSSSGDRNRGWSQMNRLHGDKTGRIFVEDVASMKTVVLAGDGEPFCDALDGEVGLAVASDGAAAMVVNDSLVAHQRYVVLSPAPGVPFERFADLPVAEPILWSSAVGFDHLKRLTVLFDTALARNFVTFASDGGILKHMTVPHQDPGYDPVRPDWLGGDGKIYTVKASGDLLQVFRLE